MNTRFTCLWSPIVHGRFPFIYLLTLLFFVTVQYCCCDMLDQCSSKGNLESQSSCESESRNTMTTQPPTQTDTSNSPQQERSNHGNQLAVVLYDENSILPLHKPERTFEFVGRDLTIKQNWGDLGVAAVVWDAAIVLCEYLERHPDIVRAKSVVELGAGTGLVGIVAAIIGSRVTITDRSIVMQFLRETVQRNLQDTELASTTIRELDWTSDLDKFHETYDIILGADIVYVEEVFDNLLETLIQLSNPETLILLSCRIRYNRDIRFLTKMKDSFDIKEIFYDTKTDVKLFQARKR